MKQMQDGMSVIADRTEISLHVPKDLNVLAKLFKTLATQSERLEAWNSYSTEDRVTFSLVVGDALATQRALETAGFDFETGPVVIVRQESGGVFAGQLHNALRA